MLQNVFLCQKKMRKGQLTTEQKQTHKQLAEGRMVSLDEKKDNKQANRKRKAVEDSTSGSGDSDDETTDGSDGAPAAKRAKTEKVKKEQEKKEKKEQQKKEKKAEKEAAKKQKKKEEAKEEKKKKKKEKSWRRLRRPSLQAGKAPRARGPQRRMTTSGK